MSTPNQWYYVKNNERYGPVEPGQLKQLADSGEIQRESLVWRVGMPNWLEAEQVQGLFPKSVQPGTPASNASSPANVTRQASPSQQQAAVQQQVAVRQPVAQNVQNVSDEEAIAEMIRPEPRTRVKAPSRTEKKSDGGFHPTPLLLDWLRRTSSRSYVDASVSLFTQIGYWSVFVFAAVLLIGGLVAAILTGLYENFGMSVGVCIAILVLQYPAIKMLNLLGSWSFTARGPRAFFDTIAILALMTGLGLTVWLIVQAIQLEAYPLLFFAVGVFVVHFHIAKVALSLPNREEGPEEECDRSTAGEWKAVFGGLLWIVVQTVPVVFGVGIALSSLYLIYHIPCLRNADNATVFTGAVLYEQYFVLGYLLLPLVAYLFSLWYRFLGKLLLAIFRKVSQ